jgi:hypothetical protein
MIPSLAPIHSSSSDSSSTARPRAYRAAALALSAVVTCALPACLIGDPAPPAPPDLDGQQVRTAFVIEAVPDQPGVGFFLILDRADETSAMFTGMVYVAHDDRATAIQVSGTMDERGEISLSTGAGGGASWDALRIAVRDQDDDGVYESGAGHMSGFYSPTYPEIYTFDLDFQAAPDAFTPTPAWAVADTAIYRQSANLLLPWQSIHIELGQPVPVDQARSYRVLADGQEVPGVSLMTAPGGMVTDLELIPHAFYPLGAEIVVESTGMTGALGAAVIFEHAPLPVMEDPGLASDNLGFEQGLTGWRAINDVRTVNNVGDVLPAEGTNMALVNISSIGSTYESRLIGHIDVPADATELDLSLAVLVPADRTPDVIAVRLYHDDETDGLDALDIYELDPFTEVFETCDCLDTDPYQPLTRRAGPLRRQIALEAFRGRRVFLEMLIEGDPSRSGVAPLAVSPEVRGLLPIPPPPPPIPGALIIDDIQIR